MKNKIIISIIISFLITILIIINYGERFNKKLKTYTDSLTTNLITTISEQLLKENLLKDNNYNIIQITKNKDDKIIALDFNSEEVNKELLKGTNILKEGLINIENGNINKLKLSSNIKNNLFTNNTQNIIEVPLGSLTNNTLLTNIGPKIPLKFQLIGSITSNADVKATNYGINNAKIDVILYFYIKERTITPVVSNDISLVVEIPLITKLIQGEVPSIYGSTMNKSSKIYG